MWTRFFALSSKTYSSSLYIGKYFVFNNYKKIKKKNQDWINPIKFNFTVAMRERRATELLPIINQQQDEHIFDISFDKKCGQDNDCHTNLVLSAILLNMT